MSRDRVAGHRVRTGGAASLVWRVYWHVTRHRRSCCERKRERERGGEKEGARECVREGERERERESGRASTQPEGGSWLRSACGRRTVICGLLRDYLSGCTRRISARGERDEGGFRTGRRSAVEDTDADVRWPLDGSRSGNFAAMVEMKSDESASCCGVWGGYEHL